MAIFKLEIADSDVDRVFDAICSNYGWQEGDGETKGEFTHRTVRDFLQNNVKAFEVKKAKEQAMNSISSNVSLSDPE